MKRAALAGLALVATTGTSAVAGPYIGLGIGPKPGISEPYEATANPQGRSLRLMGGYRFGNLSVEAAIGGVGVATAHGDDKLYSGWLAGKLSLPLSSGFEFFGRVGLHHVQTAVLNPAVDIDGSGVMAGAGFEYRLNLVATSASIYVDYTLQRATTSASDGSPNTDADMTLRTWNLGFTVGF